MSGRLEKENEYERKSQTLLRGMPSIAKQYYVYFKAGASNRTASSSFMYLSKLKLYFKYLYKMHIDCNNIKVYEKIKPSDITMYIDFYRHDGKEKGDSAVAVMFNVVKSFYTFLENNDYIQKNPCNKLKAPKVNQAPKPVSLNEDEIEKIKNCILYHEGTFFNNDENEEYWRFRDYLIFTLGCRTGLRCSAIVAIDVDDINLEDGYITVIEKGKIEKNMIIGENTIDLIRQWLVMRDRLLRDKTVKALFITKHQKRISSADIGYLINRYSTIAVPNKHITPHKMRSTCATNLWSKTHDIYMVANQLGHSNLANTRRYTDISEQELKKVANMMDDL